MRERKDILTASRVDLVLLLLPILSKSEAFCSLIQSGVPLEVTMRVLELPYERRPIEPPPFLE